MPGTASSCTKLVSADCPGPPASITSGSGAGSSLALWITAAARRMVCEPGSPPPGVARASGTVTYPQLMCSPSTAPGGRSMGQGACSQAGSGCPVASGKSVAGGCSTSAGCRGGWGEDVGRTVPGDSGTAGAAGCGAASVGAASGAGVAPPPQATTTNSTANRVNRVKVFDCIISSSFASRPPEHRLQCIRAKTIFQ